jgi:hypothetical protein
MADPTMLRSRLLGREHLIGRAAAGSMKSVRVRAPGGPEVLSLVERPVPSPGPGEVLIPC